MNNYSAAYFSLSSFRRLSFPLGTHGQKFNKIIDNHKELLLYRDQFTATMQYKSCVSVSKERCGLVSRTYLLDVDPLVYDGAL